MLYISSGVTRVDPPEKQFYERDVVTVQVVDDDGKSPAPWGVVRQNGRGSETSFSDGTRNFARHESFRMLRR